MNFLEAIISGIVQGITEFLPVSSSGHLVILHRLTGLNEPQMVFDIFLHLGTLAAIFIVFWKDIIEVFNLRKKTGFFIIVATIITVIFALFFERIVESAFANVRIVGAMLVLTGAWIILGNFMRIGTGPLSGIKAALIGLAQGIAVFPGISRSGVTISTGLFLGLDADSAARFSFLLSIPAIIGAFLYKVKTGNVPAGFNANYIAGFAASCIAGILSLKLLLRMLYKDRFYFFGFYCIVTGIAVSVFLGS